MLIEYLAVAGAGAAGAVARLAVGMVSARLVAPEYPLGTLIVNVTGSFALGWFITVAGERLAMPDTMRLAVAVGFLGSYTTFSTLMYESHALLAAGAMFRAVGNLALSLSLGLAAVRAGMWVGGR